MQAKDHFEQRKQKMMEDAIREGKGGSNSVEHPVALLDRVNTTERRIKELTQELESLQKTRDLTQLKFNELSWENDCQEQFPPISTRPKQKIFFLSVLSI